MTLALLIHLAFGNMPPPPPDTCPKDGVGAVCKTRGWGTGVCVKTTCQKTTMTADGVKTEFVDCLACRKPAPDGGVP